MTIRRQIMPGDLVVHEYDRPCGHLIRLVTAVRTTRIITRYLTAGHNPGLNGAIDADPELLTRIELFGVTYVEDAPALDAGHMLRLSHNGRPSIATYADGAPRLWQATLPATVIVRPSVWDKWHAIQRQIAAARVDANPSPALALSPGQTPARRSATASGPAPTANDEVPA